MKTILITDDETSFLTSLEKGLGGGSDAYRVFAAENGRQAVEKLESENIDLLITDLRMPVMDGFELLAWMSMNRPEIPIIVMTAFGDAQLESKLERYTTFKCFEKPIDFNALKGAIHTALATSTISNIYGVTLATFLQLMSLEKKSCTLGIGSSGRSGRLFLKNGDLINARCGTMEGMDAAVEVLGWDNTKIEMDNICREEEILIDNGIESILLAAYQLKDERNGGKTTGEHKDDDLSEDALIDDVGLNLETGSRRPDSAFEEPYEGVSEGAPVEVRRPEQGIAVHTMSVKAALKVGLVLLIAMALGVSYLIIRTGSDPATLFVEQGQAASVSGAGMITELLILLLLILAVSLITVFIVVRSLLKRERNR